jgi:hypothetical protein
MLTEPWLILHGMDPAEYTCANEFPFFSANGSIVLIEVNFAEGNAVKPLFYFTGSTTAAINFRSTFRCLLDQWFLHGLTLPDDRFLLHRLRNTNIEQYQTAITQSLQWGPEPNLSDAEVLSAAVLAIACHRGKFLGFLMQHQKFIGA